MLSEENEKLNFEDEYTGSSKNVIKNVILGKADAGAGISGAIAREPKEVRQQLRTLRKSGDIASHPLCAHPRVPEAVQDAVKQAVLALSSSPDGEEILKQVWLSTATAADYQKDYNQLEGIDVKKLSDWGKNQYK